MEEIIIALEKLAQKLGTTVEYLWPHAVRYVAYGALIRVVLPVLILSIAGYFIYRFRYREWDIEDETAKTLPKLISWIIFGIFAIVSFASSMENVAIIFEPEGYLVRHILKR